MRTGGLLAALFLITAVSQSALAAEEVGIEERLGAVIPADLQLNDEAGQPVALRSLIDKPTVLTLNYFRCAGICTPQLNDLVRTLNTVDLELGKDFQVITVSFDSSDTADLAARKQVSYLKLLKRPASPAAWRFLTGDAATTHTLTELVGFGFKKDRDAFIHPGALIILSPEGKVTRYMYGITYLPADLQMAVREAATGLARPSISKALKFCFSYDPQGHKYVLSFTRIAGSISLLIAAIFGGFLLMTGRRRDPSERAHS